MSCVIDASCYEDQLAEKVSRVQSLLHWHASHPMTVVSSPIKHYRMRAEFRVWHEADEWQYVMFDPKTKKRVVIEQCEMVTEQIARVMQPLRLALMAVPLLSERLYAIDFLASNQQELLVTLIYKQPLTDEWEALARALVLPEPIMLLGRSRGKKRTLVRDYVQELLRLPDGATFMLHHVENAFSQPNSAVNQQMLAWVDDILTAEPRKRALLELYGGSGNFTWVLSRHADRVLMTELSKQGIIAAERAFSAAGIENVTLAAMDSEQVSQALSASGTGTSLMWQGKSFDFEAIFVDPPRAGLDAITATLAARFDMIIYVSCNLDTLARDLMLWRDTHHLVAVAVFDQFPYTHHVEVGVCLRAKPSC